MRILSKPQEIADFVARFRERLSGAQEDLSESVTARIEKIFGERLSAVEVVRRIVSDVRERGDQALIELTRRIDRTRLSAADLRVSEDDIRKASSEIPGELSHAIETARHNIARFQQQILPAQPEPVSKAGGTMGIRVMPIASVGINAPGMEAPHPSTVLMCAVPASVAGVKRIAVTTPPGRNGSVNPVILAACAAAGVTEVYRIGGAQAIAALAYGTETIPGVDKIVGPGNIFVTLAKKEILGHTGIDMLCGPSEIVVVADDSARAEFVAADMLAQAEHGPMCAAIAVTTSPERAEAIVSEIERQVRTLERRKPAEESLAGFGAVILAKDVDAALRTADDLAPEHLELMIENAAEAVSKVSNAGAVFVGEYTPEVVGDYTAGPSHVLPTGGSARFFSGLSVYDFMRRFSVIEFSERGLKSEAEAVRRLAAAEGLTAHLRSLEIRFGN
jgi:histidinol dehydrogenase